jgi:cell division transport system ATP-binding protein
MNLFARFNQVGVTMLIATHDLGLLEQLGGRCIVLEGGKIENGDEPLLRRAGL